jgi:hypothetical protein
VRQSHAGLAHCQRTSVADEDGRRTSAGIPNSVCTNVMPQLALLQGHALLPAVAASVYNHQSEVAFSFRGGDLSSAHTVPPTPAASELFPCHSSFPIANASRFPFPFFLPSLPTQIETITLTTPEMELPCPYPPTRPSPSTLWCVHECSAALARASNRSAPAWRLGARLHRGYAGRTSNCVYRAIGAAN